MTIVVDPEAAGPSGVTLDELIGQVRRILSDRENLNQLSVDVDEFDTRLTFDHPLNSITSGTLLSIDNEIMYVWEVDEATRSVTVARGHQSTTAEPHTASTYITAGGKSRKAIIDAFNYELGSLSAKGLYQMKSLPLLAPTIGGPVPLTGVGNADVYDVQFKSIYGANGWHHVSGYSYSPFDATVSLKQRWNVGNYRVLYKAGFNKLVDGSDDVQVTTGLHAEATDILVWGAAIQLITPDEYIRNDFRSQGDTRRPQEVPYRAVALSVQGYQQQYNQRIAEEKDRLRRSFPVTKPGW